MQKFKIFIIMFFFAIIIVPILLFNREENFISKIDNRELMNNPLGPNYSSTASGDFTDDMETYFQDRIGLRNEMMYVYTVLNDICFDEMANNYTEGKEGYVFSKIGSNVVFNEYHIEFANMVKKIQSYCEEKEIPFVFVFNPSKATVLQEKLPEGVNYDAGWVEKFLSELEERNINYVDNTATLEEKEEEGKKVFNKKYDAGHWNDWGRSME